MNGELDVIDMNGAVHPLCEQFLSAAEQAGFKRTEDYNGRHQEGVGNYQITTRGGIRASAATAFLWPAMKRPNLQVVMGALASKLVLEDRKVVGIEYSVDGRTQVAKANREVILAAGALGSPTLLQRSGIGAGGLLRNLGIEVRHDLPAVGEHLQDHLGIDYLYRSRQPTLNGQLRSWTGRLLLGLRYLAFRDGPLSLSVNQAGGFVRSRPEAKVDTQLYFSPVSYSKSTPGVRRLTLPDPFPGFFIGTSHCRPRSRGSIRIASADPVAPPVISPNYLSAPEDMKEMIDGVRLVRRIAAQPAMAALIQEELTPGNAVQTNEELANDIRNRAGSVFHASCTCRMGPDPDLAVVDHRLRVHGLSGLRVIDASVFPSVPSGNTNAPTYMVAEKGAHMVIEDN
jgi:choline dehydrogenase